MVVQSDQIIRNVNIVIVDDHVLIREGLRKALASSSFSIVAQASGVQEGLAQISKFNPDLIIVDLQLADGSGLDLIRTINAKTSAYRKIPSVVLTMADSSEDVDAAKVAGANAYVLKSSPIVELLFALNAALKLPTSFLATTGVPTSRRNNINSFDLTAREREVLALLPSGLTFKAIAAQLFISQATVKTHAASLYRKMAVTNRSKAIKIAVENKLIRL